VPRKSALKPCLGVSLYAIKSETHHLEVLSESGTTLVRPERKVCDEPLALAGGATIKL